MGKNHSYFNRLREPLDAYLGLKQQKSPDFKEHCLHISLPIQLTVGLASMIVLGIDVGSVRVGCAWGDSSIRIPFPVAVWERAQTRAEKALLEEIKNRKAELLVVGLPLGPDGQRTPTCDLVTAFVARLSKRSSIPVVYVDEAFSSDEASERLMQAGASAKQLDAHAACLILERYFKERG